MDINTKKLKKNAFRVSKVRGLTASRVRVPGGCCNADVMQQVVDIARKYGNGQIHVTTRQGFEIEGIHNPPHPRPPTGRETCVRSDPASIRRR